MNSDTITTLCGFVKAVCVPATAFVPAPFNLIPMCLAAVAETVHGYYTNKAVVK